jgi:hypothetical protein
LLEPPVLVQPGRAALAIVPGFEARPGPGSGLRARVADGGWTREDVQIAGAASRQKYGLFGLHQRGAKLVFFARARGADFGLRTPGVALERIFARVGDTLTVSGGADRRSRWVEARGRVAKLAHGPQDAWRLLFPWSAPAPAILLAVGFLYHVVAMVPVGFWAARARVATAWRVAMMAAPGAIGLLGGAIALGASLPDVATLLGIVAGLVAGALVAARLPAITGEARVGPPATAPDAVRQAARRR